MTNREAIKVLQGFHNEELGEALELAYRALEKQVFFENEVDEIRDWFIDNKNYLLDTARKVAKDGFVEGVVNNFIDEIDLDFILENIVDEIQKGILSVLDTFKEN